MVYKANMGIIGFLRTSWFQNTPYFWNLALNCRFTIKGKNANLAEKKKILGKFWGSAIPQKLADLQN